MQRIVLTLACAAAALTTAAAASEPRNVLIFHNGAALSDRNGDGWVTRDEAAQAADRAFAHLDHNRDGVLSQADHDARRAEMEAERAAARAERDQAREEIRRIRRQSREAAHEARRVERVIEREDQVERHVVILRGPGPHPDMPEPPEPPELPHPPRAPGLSMLMSLEEADRNGDGVLSREEFRTHQLRLFDARDGNGDGRIRIEPPPTPPRPPAPPR